MSPDFRASVICIKWSSESLSSDDGELDLSLKVAMNVQVRRRNNGREGHSVPRG